MFRFCTAFSLVFAAVLIWHVSSESSGSVNLPGGLALAMVLVVAPGFSALATCAIVHHWAPRWILEPAAPHLRQLFCGAAAALLSIVGATSILIFIDGRVPGALLLTGTSSAATFVTLMVFSRRCRPGHCLTCGYDVRVSLNFGRCPECGKGI